jgi:pyruvate dehydrogenase E2 component (dihydrolipoamide acetyltransferase)
MDLTPFAPASSGPSPVAAPAGPPSAPSLVATRRLSARGPVIVSPLVRRAAEVAHVDPATLHGSGPGGVIRRADVESAAPKPAGRPLVSPRARHLAAVHGVDLGNLTGEGRGPRRSVVGADVLAAATAMATAVAPDRMRRAIASLMERAWREIPHYRVGTRIDLSAALDWMAQENAHRPVRARLLPAALLLRAVALAAARVPELNGWWVDGTFRPAVGVDLGVAVSLRRGGVVVPTLDGADRLGVDELMQRLRDVVTRARRNRLRSSELSAASLTVTALGDVGVDTVDGIVHPPQVALVGFGAIREEPWAEDGMLVVRPVVHATLAGDHRACDGRTGARFLSTVADLLGHPARLAGSTL